LTPLRCLIVLAHPLGESLNAHLAKLAAAEARAAGWDVTLRDLYAEDFDPRLTQAERASYYTGFDGDAVAAERAELEATEVLILIFPTWWFGFPAILKGWFDRVWAPGLAYDHAPDFGPMQPRLDRLREVLAITTMGAPAWVDWLILRRPLRRILRRAIIRPCAPQARVRWCALYRAEAAEPQRIARFEARLNTEIKALARRLTCPD
jgi:NAD(P)H dehydrogenase (quinone)